jgi:hypothetical protein
MSLIWLLDHPIWQDWRYLVCSSEFVVLLPNFAICEHATGACVCNIALNFLVSHTLYTQIVTYTNFFLNHFNIQK